MSRVVLGLLLALAASVALNGSYVLQHLGSRDAVAISVLRPLATLRSLLRSPVWAGGAVVGMAGWALHVGALAHAPISLVQAFVAGGIALTVPMASVVARHRASRGERRAAALMVVALLLLGVGLHERATRASFGGGALAGYVVALVLVAAVVLRTSRGRGRAAALGLAGGLAYGAADLAMKAATVLARGHGVGGALVSPWPAAVLVLSVGAFFAFQRGLQTGRPVTVIALMTAATNVSSIAGGFAVFGDPLGRTPLLAALHALAFALVGIACWWLAPSQTAVAAGVEPGPVPAPGAAGHEPAPGRPLGAAIP